MRSVRAVCFRFWPAMLVVIVLMYALDAVGAAEEMRFVHDWVEGGV